MKYMGKNESVKVLDHPMQKLLQLQQQEGRCCNAREERRHFKVIIWAPEVLFTAAQTKEKARE